MYQKIKTFFIGKALNPLSKKVRDNAALITLYAWAGLGADALSSACYGPEVAYLALGNNKFLVLYIAIALCLTIFIIAFGYNQVIKLFPTGGGGYKIATKLLNPYMGLIAGCALVVDYMLTIVISIASGTDAIFSLLPTSFMHYKLYAEVILILLLYFMNLRGIKETIKILLPIFFGFLLLHIILIAYGFLTFKQSSSNSLNEILPETMSLAHSIGWFSILGLILHAYSLGSGTYTGMEAVSNNVQRLAEPKVQTGWRAMMLMAISLSVIAGGISLLYLIWDVKPIAGQTLNAILFRNILGSTNAGYIVLTSLLLLEAAILFIAANTGFIAGPNVFSFMANDNWLPEKFKYISTRLVVHNGLTAFCIGSIFILLFTQGKVSILVVLYSINVFITFTLSLLGVAIYWLKRKGINFLPTSISLLGCSTTFTILCITLYYKFFDGGWVTLLITAILIVCCIFIKRHYQKIKDKIIELDKIFYIPLKEKDTDDAIPINPQELVAIIITNNHISFGMNALNGIHKHFPNRFKNFVFINVGTIDSEALKSSQELEKLTININETLDYFVDLTIQNGFAAKGYCDFGTDHAKVLEKIIDKLEKKYPYSIYFSTRLVFGTENILTSQMHIHLGLIIQAYLHLKNKEMFLYPLKV